MAMLGADVGLFTSVCPLVPLEIPLDMLTTCLTNFTLNFPFPTLHLSYFHFHLLALGVSCLSVNNCQVSKPSAKHTGQYLSTNISFGEFSKACLV